MSSCECANLEGFERIRCMSPPPGEFEVDIDLGQGKHLIVNEEGFLLRQLITDESLPFLLTSERPLPPERLVALARISYEELECMVARNLEKAAKAGSIKAKRKLQACMEIHKSLLDKCKPGEPSRDRVARDPSGLGKEG
ncbi:MAG: hypothetical protein F7C07_05285 [Desulfurococcales archaeon]|nr:hypothetical protein [Desulfurococcales archaeon]